MKKFVHTATITLLFASFVTATQAQNFKDAPVTHLGGSAAIPNSAQFQGATHKFEVYVRGKALSELAIELPKDISIHKGIEITNQTGKKVEATASIENRKARIVFSQPFPTDTKLSINMQGVTTPGYEGIWLYKIYGKMVGVNGEIPLGTVRIQTYSG
ncbi:DUF2808 domain-containing protein [Microcoleus sp. F4-D5]|uniref:DUF2808 domain-containing protein n=1 Tax=Microcoleus sp. F4-D5 TaxID=2818760 RepID=UPI002FD1D40A